MPSEYAEKQAPKVFPSIEEFKKHYFPDAYAKEQKEKRMNLDPKELGKLMAEEFLESIRRELEKLRDKPNA